MTPRIHICLLVTASVLGACRGQTSSSPPIVPLRNMHQQQRYNPQAESHFFADGRTMRTPVAHTVAAEAEIDPVIATGRNVNGIGYVDVVPATVVQRLGSGSDMVERGEGRYNIYCRPCHDGAGTGQGTVIKRGMVTPPSLHEDRIKHMPDGQLFATISNGVRNMPAYRAQIPVNDRWAIVSYVRALELSQPSLANAGSAK